MKKTKKKAKKPQEAGLPTSMIKAQNRLVGVIQNTEIYRDDDQGENTNKNDDSSYANHSDAPLQLTTATGGKKQATFL